MATTAVVDSISDKFKSRGPKHISQKDKKNIRIDISVNGRSRGHGSGGRHSVFQEAQATTLVRDQPLCTEEAPEQIAQKTEGK